MPESDSAFYQGNHSIKGRASQSGNGYFRPDQIDIHPADFR